MKGRLGIASVAVLVALLARAVPAFADSPPPPPPPPTQQQEAFRSNVQTMFDGLTNVVAQVQGNPSLAATLQKISADPKGQIASAKQQVAQLSSTDLDRLNSALAANPAWQQAPSTAQSAVSAFPQPSSIHSLADFAGTFTDSCNSAGSAPSEFQAVLGLNEAQSAAQAAMLAAPGVIAVFVGIDIPTGVKIALAVIWGVLNAVYLALAQTLAVSTDCALTAFQNTQATTFPTDPNNPSTVVAGSSEISITRIITAAQGTQTEVTSVLSTVNAVNTQSDTLTTQANNLGTTLTDINNRANELTTDLQTLQTNVAILESTEVTVLGKANQEIVNLSNLQTLQIRMEIEANLARPTYTSYAVALFQLPAAFGGFLEVAKSIAHDAVAKQTAVGHGNANAAGDLQAGDNAFAAGHFKLAYQNYSKAYIDVIQ